MPIPLVVALWEDINFGGRRRVLAEDEPDLTQEGFNDTVSSIGVHPGPDYEAWKAANGAKEPTVGVYKDVYYGGAQLILTAGVYPDIGALFNFNDVISSVKFNPAQATAAPIQPIPLVLHIYKDANFKGQETQIVENVPNIISYLGGDWNDVISSVWIEPGPNYTGIEKASLYRDVATQNQPFGSGGHIDLGVGTYPNLGFFNFNDVTSAIQITGPRSE